MQSMGYDGMLQNHKHRADTQPCANATFWRKDKFVCVNSIHKSRTLTVGLKFIHADSKDEIDVVVINVHLEASQTSQAARAAQFASALSSISKLSSSSSSSSLSSSCILVSGDFNTGADSALHHTVRNHKIMHAHLASVYEHPSTLGSTPVQHCTFAVGTSSTTVTSKGQVNTAARYSIDHILYTHNRLNLMSYFDMLHHHDMREYEVSPSSIGWPSMRVPSDHLPIAAVFEFVPIIHATDTAKSVNGMNSDELWMSGSNSLTHEQRAAVTDYEAKFAVPPSSSSSSSSSATSVSSTSKSSKPTATEIAAMQAAAKLEKSEQAKLKEGMSEEQKEFVALWLAKKKKERKGSNKSKS